MGLHCWRSFLIKHFPRLNNGIKFGQFWFHKYADMQVFIHEIIKPMEIVAKESLERSPLGAISLHGLVHILVIVAATKREIHGCTIKIMIVYMLRSQF